MKHLLPLILMLLPQLCWAIDLETIEQVTRSHGYQDNVKRLKIEPYYSAIKRLNADTSFTVDAFFAGKKKERIKQIKLASFHCSKNSLSEKQFSQQTEDEMQKLFRSLFNASLPANVADPTHPVDLKKEVLNIPGITRLRTSMEQPYCDATPGGSSFILNVFLGN